VPFGIALGLGLAEVATRVAGGGEAALTRGMFFQFDREAGWRCRAGVDLRFVLPGDYDVRVRCNSQGLRDREHPFAKPAGVRRLLCLGDSYTWGQGVENEQMFASVLERELPGSETINFGVAGYSAVQELVRLETDGLSYAPDWTVVLFCDNDLDGDFSRKGERRPVADLREDGALHVIHRPVEQGFTEPVTRWLRTHSRLAIEFDYRVRLMGERLDEQRAVERAKGPVPPDRRALATTGKVDASAPAHTLRARDIEFSLIDRFLPPDDRMDQAWRTLGQIYAAMRDMALQHGSRLLVVYVPDPRLALEPVYRELLRQAGATPAQSDWDRPSKRLAGLCHELGVPCLDLVPLFRRAPDPARLFHHRDPHWSAAGAELAAKAAAERIRELDPAAGSKR
jgi:hypothetical protein